MAKIAYLPFAGDDQLRGEVEVIVQKFRGSWGGRFDATIRVHSATEPVLRNTSTSTEVYIFCHGGARSDEVGDYNHHRLSVGDLALQLFADGLDPAHRTLKLYSCRSAVGGIASTAYRLWQALFDLHPPGAGPRFRGYKSLDVYGYTSTLITDHDESVGADGHKRAVNEGNLHQTRESGGRVRTPLFVRASEVRVKFGVSYRAPA